jgi:hypothetical protein
MTFDPQATAPPSKDNKNPAVERRVRRHPAQSESLIPYISSQSSKRLEVIFGREYNIPSSVVPYMNENK